MSTGQRIEGTAEGRDSQVFSLHHSGFAGNIILLLMGFNGIHKRYICPILGLIYLKNWNDSLRTGKMFCRLLSGIFYEFHFVAI